MSNQVIPVTCGSPRLAKAAGLVAATALATLAGAAIAAGLPQGQMASDLAARDPDIHWPAGFEPEKADLFAHNQARLNASCDTVWRHIVDARAWPTWYPNAQNVTLLGNAEALAPDVRWRWTTFGLAIESRVDEFVPGRRLGWFGGAPGEAPANCRRCDLWKRATQAVNGEGSRHAAIMLVGEQPGDEEDHRGHPFVGPAGRLLDEALEEAGLARGSVYITNAVKHFKWEPRGKRRLHKKPGLREINACSVWLEQEITEIAPGTIVALGSTALRALTKVRAHLGSLPTCFMYYLLTP